MTRKEEITSRPALQGVFEFLTRDRAPSIFEGYQLDKTLRVVTTI